MGAIIELVAMAVVLVILPALMFRACAKSVKDVDQLAPPDPSSDDNGNTELRPMMGAVDNDWHNYPEADHVVDNTNSYVNRGAM